jgi:hypothetical protein
MARKIELRTTTMLVKNDAGGPVVLKWGEMMMTVLRTAPQGGVNLDQMVRTVEAMRPITKALDEAADCVTLTDEQYRTLRERLDQHNFGISDPAIVEFGLAIRNASEIT